jgi:hypothetical protein
LGRERKEYARKKKRWRVDGGWWLGRPSLFLPCRTTVEIAI